MQFSVSKLDALQMIEEEEVEVPVPTSEGGPAAMEVETNQSSTKMEVPDLNDPNVDNAEYNAAYPSGVENGEPAGEVKSTEMESPKVCHYSLHLV